MATSEMGRGGTSRCAARRKRRGGGACSTVRGRAKAGVRCNGELVREEEDRQRQEEEDERLARELAGGDRKVLCHSLLQMSQ